MSETNEQRYLRMCWLFDESFRRLFINLANNITVAGALCRAHDLGNFELGFNWWPGCGRSAPR